MLCQRLNIISASHADDRYVLSRLNLTNNLEERNDARSDLVPAGGHHPLFKVWPSDSIYGSVIIHAKQHHAAAEVRECDQFLGEGMVFQNVALEFNAGAFPVGDDFQ